MGRTLARLWALLTPRQRWQAAGLALLLVLSAIVEMVGVGLIPVYIGVLAEPDRLLKDPAVAAVAQSILGHGVAPTPAQILYGGTFVMFSMFTLKLVFTPLVARARGSYIQQVVQAQSTRLFNSYMTAPYQFHLARPSAELIRNITVECNRLGEALLNPLVGMLSQLLVTIAIVLLLAIRAPGIALATLFGLGLITVPLVSRLTRRTRHVAATAQTGRMRVIQSAQEGLTGVKEIALLGRQSYFIDRFSSALKEVLHLQRHLLVTNAVLPVLMEWLAAMALLAVVLLLFEPGASAGGVIGVVALFAVALARLKGSVAGVLASYAIVRSSVVSLGVIDRDIRPATVIGRAEQDPVVAGPARRSNFSREIVLEDVWFRYQASSEPVLRGINLTIRKGEAIGFVGPSGGGKSTLIDLILGVLQPERGTIAVDGVDTRQNLVGWQSNLGYVPQSIYIFDGTIRQNVALGLEADRIDNAAVHRAAQAANLTSFICNLPAGLDTLVGERGARMSGGERQRVAIARALYDDPEVLIMDEATSALDNLTERAVMEAVEALKGERTILMIAHRLSTVRGCDRIVYLKDGKIIAIGTYAELTETQQDFRRFAAAS